MLLLHRRLARAWRASPRIWTASLASASSAANSQLPYDEAFAAACDGLSFHERKKLKRDLQFERVVPALSAFHAATGHWIVPYHFPIPSFHTDGSLDVKKNPLRKAWIVGRVRQIEEIAWPRSAGGLNLGRTIDKLMKIHQDEYPEVVEELREIGFPVDVDWREYSWTHQKMAALRIFHRLHGHSIVPIQFVVPDGDDTTWPVCTWGLRLGRLVDFLRCKYEKLSDDDRDDLESINFSVNVHETEWSVMILPALETFAKINGDCVVRKKFVVPSEEPWPKMTWRLKLGRVVGSIRTSGTYAEQIKRDADRLDAINFIWRIAEYRWKEIVLPTFEVYDRLLGNLNEISYEFIVPSKAPWPEEAWELHLGAVVRNIRYKGYFVDQTTQDAKRLEELGLEWKRSSREKGQTTKSSAS